MPIKEYVSWCSSKKIKPNINLIHNYRLQLIAKIFYIQLLFFFLLILNLSPLLIFDHDIYNCIKLSNSYYLTNLTSHTVNKQKNEQLQNYPIRTKSIRTVHLLEYTSLVCSYNDKRRYVAISMRLICLFWVIWSWWLCGAATGRPCVFWPDMIYLMVARGATRMLFNSFITIYTKRHRGDSQKKYRKHPPNCIWSARRAGVNVNVSHLFVALHSNVSTSTQAKMCK